MTLANDETMENNDKAETGPVANLRCILPSLIANRKRLSAQSIQQAVKVFSAGKEEGHIPLPGSQDDDMPQDVRRGSELTKSVFRNKKHGESSIQSDVSSLTASTSGSDVSYSDDETTVEDTLSWHEKQPKKSSLKIGTQHESLIAAYRREEDELNETIPLEQQSESFVESFMSGCFCQDTGGHTNPKQPSPQSTVSIATERDSSVTTDGPPKVVTFSHVQTHYHFQTLGSQLTVKQGPPLSLGKFMNSTMMSVNRFEKLRRRSVARARDLLIPAERRREILLRAGVTKWEMNRCEKIIQAERKELDDKKGKERFCVPPSSVVPRPRGAVGAVIKIVSQLNRRTSD